MEYQEFSAIYKALKSASANSSLNQGNVIEAIKIQLSQDSDAYKEWEKGNFSLDHVFTTVNGGIESKYTLLMCACKSADLEVVDFLLKAGANFNIQTNGMSLLEWAKFHQPDPVIKKEDMEEIINTLKAPSKEKGQNSESTGKQTPVNGSNKTPEKNDTTFWSEHKGKIALSVTELCVAGAVAAYVLAYPAAALALAVLSAVILMGAGVAKVCEKVEKIQV